MNETFDLVIVGGGPAGVTAALHARALGAERVALLERGVMGGVCTNDGCVPMRVLAKAARLLRDAKQWADYGIDGEPSQLHVGRLMGRVRQVIAEMHEKKRMLERLDLARVVVRARVGPARFVDSHTLAVGVGDSEERFTGKRILLCAGGQARRLPIQGGEYAHSHSDLWNLETLPESVLIIGASATGCQAASVLKAFGVGTVTLVDTAQRILPQEDDFISETVTRGFVEAGITVLTGIGGVSNIERGEGESRRVTLQRGDGKDEIHTADFVLVCVGWPGNLEPLQLEIAGEPGNFKTRDIGTVYVLVMAGSVIIMIAEMVRPLAWANRICFVNIGLSRCV